MDSCNNLDRFLHPYSPVLEPLCYCEYESDRRASLLTSFLRAEHSTSFSQEVEDIVIDLFPTVQKPFRRQSAAQWSNLCQIGQIL